MASRAAGAWAVRPEAAHDVTTRVYCRTTLPGAMPVAVEVPSRV